MSVDYQLLTLSFYFSSLGSLDTIEKTQIRQLKINNQPICNKIYKNKNNGQLFQDEIRLTLNCDSTFSYKHLSCTSRDTCYGTWQKRNDNIYLIPDKKIIQRLSNSLKYWDKYTDLSKSTLEFKLDYVICKRSQARIDTLYTKWLRPTCGLLLGWWDVVAIGRESLISSGRRATFTNLV